MNNMKIYEKNLRKKAGVIVLSLALGATSIAMTGCSKDKEEEKSKVAYTVEDVNFDKKVILDYPSGVSDVAEISDDVVVEKYIDYGNADSYRKGVDFVYPLRELHVTSKGMFNGERKAMTTATFKRDNMIVVPDCYKWAEEYFGEGFTDSIGDIDYDIYELKGLDGNYYVDYEYNINFKKNINVPGFNYLADQEFYQKYGEQKHIEKGDNLNYKALYKVDYNKDSKQLEYTTIADQFTGMGEDAPNIQKVVKNNYDEVYKDISTLGISENKEFESFVEMEFELYKLNDNSKVRK